MMFNASQASIVTRPPRFDRTVNLRPIDTAVADASIDVVISNCVSNLSVDQAAVMLSFDEYRSGLEGAGLTDIDISPTHTVGDGLHGAIIRATKPVGWSAGSIRPFALPVPVAGSPALADASSCGGTGCC